MKQSLNRMLFRLSAVAGAALFCTHALAEETGGAEDSSTGVLGSLGLDPRTVIVQALAFIILLWVLKKILWGPVLHVIAERQAEVEHTYKEAEQAQSSADAARKDYEARLAQADEEGHRRVASALAKANTMRDEIIANARQQADRIVASGHENVRQEMEKAQSQIRTAATGMAVDLAGRIIEQNINAESQRSLIDRFIEGVGTKQ